MSIVFAILASGIIGYYFGTNKSTPILDAPPLHISPINLLEEKKNSKHMDLTVDKINDVKSKLKNVRERKDGIKGNNEKKPLVTVDSLNDAKSKLKKIAKQPEVNYLYDDAPIDRIVFKFAYPNIPEEIYEDDFDDE